MSRFWYALSVTTTSVYICHSPSAFVCPIWNVSPTTTIRILIPQEQDAATSACDALRPRLTVPLAIRFGSLVEQIIIIDLAAARSQNELCTCCNADATLMRCWGFRTIMCVGRFDNKDELCVQRPIWLDSGHITHFWGVCVCRASSATLRTTLSLGSALIGDLVPPIIIIGPFHISHTMAMRRSMGQLDKCLSSCVTSYVSVAQRPQYECIL